MSCLPSPTATSFSTSRAPRRNVALREEAVRKKLSISEYGIQDTETGEVFTDKTEEALYKRPTPIPPELRENMGELEAAREGRIRSSSS